MQLEEINSKQGVAIDLCHVSCRKGQNKMEFYIHVTWILGAPNCISVGRRTEFKALTYMK